MLIKYKLKLTSLFSDAIFGTIIGRYLKSTSTRHSFVSLSFKILKFKIKE